MNSWLAAALFAAVLVWLTLVLAHIANSRLVLAVGILSACGPLCAACWWQMGAA